MNKELEVINAVLQNKDISVLYGQNVDSLFNAYSDIWQGIKNYYAKYNAVPDISVIQERYDIEAVPVGKQTEPYLDGLREEYISNRIGRLLVKGAEALETNAPESVLNKLQAELAKLNEVSAGAQDVNIMDFDIAERHYDAVRERAQAMGGQPGVPTGIAFIDSAYPTGLQAGDLVVAFGYTARGKSMFTTLLACNAHEYGYKPMIATLEMSDAKVRDRAFTIKGSGVFSNSDLMLGDYSPDEFREFKKAQQDKPEFIVVTNEGASELNPNVVEAKIDQHHPDIVILDYAQLMADNRNSDQMTQRMMNLSKELKRLAVKKQVIIVLISSATAEGVSKADEPPGIQSVAWSRQISFDADLAFAVHKYEDSDLMEIVCAKNRNGPLFAGALDWDINNGIIKEVFA